MADIADARLSKLREQTRKLQKGTKKSEVWDSPTKASTDGVDVERQQETATESISGTLREAESTPIAGSDDNNGQPQNEDGGQVASVASGDVVPKTSPERNKRRVSASGGSGKRQRRQSDTSATSNRLQYAASIENLLDIEARQSPRYEELHRRATFWYSNELLDEIEAFSNETGISKAQVMERGAWLFMRLYKDRG